MDTRAAIPSAPKRRYWRRPFVLVLGAGLGGAWVVSGTRIAVAGDGPAERLGGVAFAVVGLLVVVGALAHVTACARGIAVVYGGISVRRWSWDTIANVTVVDVRSTDVLQLGDAAAAVAHFGQPLTDLAGRAVVANWVPTLVLADGGRAPLTILSEKRQRTAQLVAGSIRSAAPHGEGPAAHDLARAVRNAFGVERPRPTAHHRDP